MRVKETKHEERSVKRKKERKKTAKKKPNIHNKKYA